jgi:acyl-CoA thioesterase FadM
MYPLLRFLAEHARHSGAPDLDLFDSHVSEHLIWPHDLDPWLELNNGRTLTLYDFGRTVLFRRTGLAALMKARGWGGTVAGSSVRYRRRVKAWDRIEMRSRIEGWDDRFVYLTQGMWRDGECTSHALFRTAVIGRSRQAPGVVPTAEVAAALRAEPKPLPAWITAWAEAEALRPWPPEG